MPNSYIEFYAKANRDILISLTDSSKACLKIPIVNDGSTSQEDIVYIEVRLQTEDGDVKIVKVEHDKGAFHSVNPMKAQRKREKAALKAKEE